MRRHTVLALLILALALSVRFAALAATFHGNDEVLYYDDAKIALNLIEGRGYSIDMKYRNWLFYEVFLNQGQLDHPVTEGVKPTASKQPLYPLILAFMFLVFGAKNFLAVFLFHALVASLTAVILFFALRTESIWRAALVGFGFAVYPAFVIHSITTPESTTVVLFLVALLLLCVRRLAAAPSSSRSAAIGVVGGVLILAEPVTLPFVVATLGYTAFLMLGNPRLTRGLAAATVLFALVLSPWFARNYIVFHKFPVLKSAIGTIFNWGLERSGRGSWISDERLIALEREGRQKTEVEEDGAIRRELLAAFPAHAKEYVTYNVPSNFLHFWWEVDRYAQERPRSYLIGRTLPYACLLLLAVPGMATTLVTVWRRGRRALVTSPFAVCALSLTSSLTSIYSIFGAYMSRYRFPVELCLIFFAACTVELIVERYGVPFGRLGFVPAARSSSPV